MILQWAALMLGLSEDASLISIILKLTGMRSPSAMMNYLLRDPIGALNRIRALPTKYRKLLETNIAETIKKKFKGAIKLDIDFKKLAEVVSKDKNLAKAIGKWNDTNAKVKKNGLVDVNKDAIANIRKEETDKLESEIGQFVKMSSSWVSGGVITEKLQGNELRVDIYTHGKPYEFVVKISTWNRMVRAIGSHGTGAGSVLWDTELRYKRANVRSVRAKHARKGR